MKKLLLVTLSLIITSALYAQDRIYKRNGEILETKIVELGEYEVKYKGWDNQEGITYILEISSIKKILFSSGDVKVFDNNFIAPLPLAEQRKNAIKIGFLDPLIGYLPITFERHLKPGRSLEIGVGIIGIGGDVEYENAEGASIKLGYKFSHSPEYFIRNMKQAHVLNSTYIRPDIVFSMFSADTWTYGWHQPSQQTRHNMIAGALMVTFGKQMVFDNRFIIDTYLGFGYGFTSSSEQDESGYLRVNYGFMGGDVDFPIAINAGLRLGLAFGK